MPQGITGAPATFQRFMEKAVGDMHLLQVIVYLNDIVVFEQTLEEHEERLLNVLDRLPILSVPSTIRGTHCVCGWNIPRSSEDRGRN